MTEEKFDPTKYTKFDDLPEKEKPNFVKDGHGKPGSFVRRDVVRFMDKVQMAAASRVPHIDEYSLSDAEDVMLENAHKENQERERKKREEER